MIVYGTDTSHLLTGPVKYATCPACGTPDTLRASVFGRYLHVYWLPLLPVGKVSASECEHCHQVLQGKQMPPALRTQVAQLKEQANTPVWHFAGLLLAALLVVGGLMSSHFNRQHTAAYVAQPHVGDVYHVKMDDGYSLLKVAAVEGNSVKLLANTYQADTDSRLAELDKPENYDHEPVDITPLDLQIMLHKEQITEVERR